MFPRGIPNRPSHCFQQESNTGLRIQFFKNRIDHILSQINTPQRPSTSVQQGSKRGLYILSYKNPKRPSRLVPKEPQTNLHILSQKNPREVFTFSLKGTPKIRGFHSLSQRSPKSAYTFFPKGTKAAPKRALCSVPKEPQRGLHILYQRDSKEGLLLCPI